MDLTGVAAVITASALFVGAVAAGYVTIKTAKTVKASHDKIIQIDHAVNGKEEGAQTMVSQVDALYGDRPVSEVVEINGAALLPLVRLLVADMKKRQEAEEAG